MNKKAVTLLEILISVLILAMLMAGMAGLFISGKKWILHARTRATSSELTKKALSYLQGQVSQASWGSNCLSATGACFPVEETLGPTRYTAAYTTSNVGTTGLRRAVVQITWDEPD